MIKVHILHAGINHPSPYFYNFCNYLKKYADFEYVVDSNLPEVSPEDKGVIYFNRLKRFYDSNDINIANSFLDKIDNLKSMGWKIVWTLHNFYPIDRTLTNVDTFVTKKFINKCDLVFTLSECLKKSIKENFGIDAINHGMGFNILDNYFNKNIIDYKKDKFTFTFVGNIYKYKMLDKIIDEVSMFNECNLVIAGTESKNANVHIEELIKGKDNIYFYNGFVGIDDWNKISEFTDCFISLYDYSIEAFKYGLFPSNCINIYNLGIPCISNDHESIREMLDDDQMIYFNDIDENGLYNAIKYALKHKSAKKNNNVLDRYSWDKQIEIFTKGVRGLYE